MTKFEFLAELGRELSGLPEDNIEEYLTFYSEMIDDIMEEGLSEDEAIGKIGTVQETVSQIIADIPLTKLVKEKIKHKRSLKAWEIVLLALGSPIWMSLLISVFAVVLSVYISLSAVIISLWAVFVSLIGCMIGGIAAGGLFAFSGKPISGIFMIGSGIICAGLSIFMFFGCRLATKWLLIIAKKAFIKFKNCFVKKEAA